VCKRAARQGSQGTPSDHRSPLLGVGDRKAASLPEDRHVRCRRKRAHAAERPKAVVEEGAVIVIDSRDLLL
jgi:hypothetical protein